jgi:hypothetical protein
MRRKLNFKIENYTISSNLNSSHLIIEGYKLPPPSKRITLSQKNIKVLSAKVVYRHKKGDIEVEVIRINAIKSFGEIRLHTESLLYPGNYHIELEYAGELDENALRE